MWNKQNIVLRPESKDGAGTSSAELVVSRGCSLQFHLLCYNLVIVNTITSGQKFFYNLIANVVFLLHLFLVLVVCIGWAFPSLFYLFLFLLSITALSEIFLGYCILTKWEFSLRKKIDPSRQFDTSCIFHYGRAMFGLGPRVPTNKKEAGFFKKYSSLLVLLLPLLGAILVKFGPGTLQNF